MLNDSITVSLNAKVLGGDIVVTTITKRTIKRQELLDTKSTYEKELNIIQNLLKCK